MYWEKFALVMLYKALIDFLAAGDDAEGFLLKVLKSVDKKDK